MKSSNKEVFQKLVSEHDNTTKDSILLRKQNRLRLRESQSIALKVLSKLEELGWTQKMLAKKIGVSPQQITKIVKGKENLTLESQVKLQETLDIPILATYYEKRLDSKLTSLHKTGELES